MPSDGFCFTNSSLSFVLNVGSSNELIMFL
nr:MAG TPA: hypothetical protein [Caudoviricetes sp.]